MDDNAVPITLVWLDSSKATDQDERVFPEDVLSCLEEEFDITGIFASEARPTAVAILDETKYEALEEFLEKEYPNKVSLGLFY